MDLPRRIHFLFVSCRITLSALICVLMPTAWLAAMTINAVVGENRIALSCVRRAKVTGVWNRGLT